jgi:hypothetical protein
MLFGEKEEFFHQIGLGIGIVVGDEDPIGLQGNGLFLANIKSAGTSKIIVGVNDNLIERSVSLFPFLQILFGPVGTMVVHNYKIPELNGLVLVAFKSFLEFGKPVVSD